MENHSVLKKTIISCTLLLVLLFVSACSAAPAGKNAGDSTTTLTKLNRDRFSSYASTFNVTFQGASTWTYQLRTRKSPTLREINLHMDGVEKSANPGDVRIVTDGKTSWMIGPGTDGECVQFPNNQGMDPTLLTPEMLIPEANLTSLLKLKGEENVNGINSLHYTGSAPSAGDWKDAQVDVWQDAASQGLLRFTMQAAGTDPFFGKGAGKLSANYEAAALDVAEIEPVKGCEISISLPENATNFVRLPGLASFDSPAAIEEIRAYYQAQLPQGGWTELEPEQQSQGVTVLSYQRPGERVEIQVEAGASGGSKVKLIFINEP